MKTRLRFLFLPLLVTIGVTSTPGWAFQAPETTIDLRQIMDHPDWMGPPVETAWWQLEGDAVSYRMRRAGTSLHDTRTIQRTSGEDQLMDHAARAGLDGPEPVLDREGRRAVFVRDGNLFLRERQDGQWGELVALTRSSEADQNPVFSADGNSIHFLRGSNWWSIDLNDRIAGPVADLQFEAAPDAEPEETLSADQLRLFEHLRRERERAQERLAEEQEAARQDPTRGPATWYLGEGQEKTTSALSPDRRWKLVAVQPAGAPEGRADAMPSYVTLSGYVEVQDVRTLVGRNQPAGQSLWLLDLVEQRKIELSHETLEGLTEDPLADLKEEQGLDLHDQDNPRPVRIAGMNWHPDGQIAAIQFRSVDNKDRWIATVDVADESLVQRHRLTDPGWINWAFNDFGWLPESRDLWLLSEETGHSHFHTVNIRTGRIHQHTSGPFKVSDPVVSREGDRVYLMSNRSHPTEYDLYRLDLADDSLERLTELRGLESFSRHPLTGEVLLRYSSAYLPTQLALLDSEGELTLLTDTRTEEYRRMEWQYPEIVGIESSHGAPEPIWSKFYPARGEEPDGGRPAVLFVHGAGYLQNTHHRYPQYFREQMFHNLLTEMGYLVLDMDFRASQGYGRDWRTAIYRQMGTPELEDLVDGVNWLVEEHGADPERIGVYGGSYGGFMAFMALFREPGMFQAGAALRPVTDWAHYNHPYTSNILNTPEVDPEAYRRSSPIEFAEGLEGHLLITHGMQDDNVFYQDVIRLAQRLIELEKENWELASYPLEAHAFQQPESWLDQYRRILRLFETTIGQTP